jgi:hypothetical protein
MSGILPNLLEYSNSTVNIITLQGLCSSLARAKDPSIRLRLVCNYHVHTTRGCGTVLCIAWPARTVTSLTIIGDRGIVKFKGMTGGVVALTRRGSLSTKVCLAIGLSDAQLSTASPSQDVCSQNACLQPRIWPQ